MRRRSEMKLVELAELVYKMKDGEVIDFAHGNEEVVEYWGGWCGVKKINEFSNDNPMYLVSHYGGEAEAYLYHISEYDHRIGDFVAEEMPVWWKVTDRNRINCCAKMIADYCENWGEGFVPEVFTVDCYDCDEERYI